MAHYIHYKYYQKSYDTAKRDSLTQKERDVIDNIDYYPEREYQSLINDHKPNYRAEEPMIYIREAYAKIREGNEFWDLNYSSTAASTI